jgi:(1->4)-alpha-D-glucan 1-alpha-D-glucosylmutase
MKIPRAAYRLQLHSKFTFQDAEKIVDYLSRLGMSDIYASPIFKSRKDSPHGYDIVDPSQINPQLGGKQAFEQLAARARESGLGWLQDIVPNHMAFDSENRLLMDILEKGPRSRYYSFFDIQWDHPYEHLRGKLLVPLLGDLYGRCLDNNDIKLNFDEDGFNIRFYDWKFPLKIGSYTKVLASNLPWLEDRIQRDGKDYIQFLETSHQFNGLSESFNSSDHYSHLALMKARLWQLYLSNNLIKGYIDAVVTDFNGTAGDSHSLNKLDELLSEQYFKLSFWKVGNEELNYRRFFTVNGLVSLRMENQEVFEHTHNLIFQLVKSGQITGVRIDHVDGLYEPMAYLNKLKQREENLYIALEKILDINEKLPAGMPVQGTTGYDFMNVVNEVFIDRDHEKMMDQIYTSFTGQDTSYRELVIAKKKLFMGRHMAGDIDNLAQLLKQIINADRYGKDMTMYALRRGIVEIMAQFPVYRSYLGEQELSEKDKVHIKTAIAMAGDTSPVLINELNFISRILLLEFEPDLDSRRKEEYVHFTKKFQQFSGALMAKGAEDTTFYIYNRFISLNEVGSDPSIFGLSLRDFHDFMIERQRKWPFTMNSTSTHDTKRGEDVRARLNVLSEMPANWRQKVTYWGRINNDKKTIINGAPAPDRNDEYFIYQTLVGAYPFDDTECGAFAQRMKEYIIKAVREAKIHSTWIRQDNEYEQACVNFIDELLRPIGKNEFLDSFLPFQRKIAFSGSLNSLSQILLKMTCPGVPDFYQGTELWDLSLVDPDNRRPVDYSRRMALLQEVKEKDNLDFLKMAAEHKNDGRMKFFLISKVLEARRKYEDLFLRGEYIPLEVRGELNEYVIAFARKWGQVWSITAVPRFSWLFAQRQAGWQDAFLSMPPEAPPQWQNALTGDALNTANGISLQEVFRHFPAGFMLAASGVDAHS